jgi:hypothetical protein
MHAGDRGEPTPPASDHHQAPDLAWLRGVDSARPTSEPPRLVFPPALQPQPAKGGFPVLPFAFMLAMAVVVAGLGLSLAVRRMDVLGPRETSGAEDAGGERAASSGRAGGDVPYCDGVALRQEGQIARALTLMQRTREGQRLVQQLAKHDVCIGVEQLAYNSAYASAERSWLGDWDDSYIVIDTDLLAVAEPDVLAALLVHEATHIDRYVRGKACGLFDGCEVLANGVVVEEEVAAHGAEAKWWIDVYGSGGRRVASGYGYSLDALVAAYLRGDDAFREYVVELRSDPRDGAGL